MLLIRVLEIASVVLAVMTTVLYAYQAVYLFIPMFIRRKKSTDSVPHRFAILIAARNEEEVLPDLLKSIRAQDYPEELIDAWVVADNCTDHTARRALENGAHVVSRTDPDHVGKGYALRFLLDHIQEAMGKDAYDAYLIIDADNILKSDYVSRINETCSQGYDVFCGYRNSKNFGTNMISAGHSVWYLHDSTHLNRSRQLLGVPCVVNGTGFGFTAELLERCGGWHFFCLTEDLEFSNWCTTHGVRVGYNHDAILYDEQPETASQSQRQRTRWTQGGIQIAFRCLTDMLRGIATGGVTTYATLEILTLTLWGYLLGGLCGVTNLLNSLLRYGWAAAGKVCVVAVISFLAAVLLTGFLTVTSEWKRIYATNRQKIMGIFAFVLFIITFIPIAIAAVFRRRVWVPIIHRRHAEELIAK